MRGTVESRFQLGCPWLRQPGCCRNVASQGWANRAQHELAASTFARIDEVYAGRAYFQATFDLAGSLDTIR